MRVPRGPPQHRHRHCPAPLLECITVTRAVSGRMAAATSAALTSPSPFTGTAVCVSRPWAANEASVSATAGCSMLEDTTWGTKPSPWRMRAAIVAPQMALQRNAGMEAGVDG